MQFIIFVNPNARKYSQKKLQYIIKKFDEKNFSYKIFISKSIKYFQQYFPSLINSYKNEKVTIIIIGGDGTINKICNTISNLDTKNKLLGIIPLGTANILSKEFNINEDIDLALKNIFKRDCREIALSQINEKYFIFSCGIGFDGEVVKEVNEKLKKNLGAFAYAFKGFQLLNCKSFKKFRIKVDNYIEYDVCSLIINRTQRYGINKKIFKTAYILSDYFIIAIFKKLTVSTILKFFFGIRSDDYIFRKAKKIEILSNKDKIPVQIDGEFVDITPDIIKISEKKINFIIP